MTQHIPEALRIADWLRSWALAVQTYPQQSEEEPGGYSTKLDQFIDAAERELRNLHSVNTELLPLVKGSRHLALEKLNGGYDTEYWQQIISEIDAAISKSEGCLSAEIVETA